MLKTSKYSELLYYIFLLLLSIVFVSVFCEVSTPLSYRYTPDSSMYIVMGKMFADGKVPYLDFFDHKGPSIMFLQGIGQMFAPYRLGLFFLELLNLFLALVIITKTSALAFSRSKNIIIITSFLILFSRIASKGNTNEELSFVPLFLSLYFVCKYLFKEKKIVWSDGLVIGLCFSFLFWLRLNNAGNIVAICVFLFISTIVDKDYKSLKNLVLYFIIGQLPFTIFYLGYFLYHDAVYDMIHGTFLFNFNYVNELFTTKGDAFWVNFVVFSALLLGSILHYMKYRGWKIILFSVLLFFFNYLTVNIGYGYMHYYILMCPAFVFGCILIVKILDNKKLIHSLLIVNLLVLGALTARGGYYIVSEGEYFKNEAKEIKARLYEVIDMIPEDERDRMYAYGIDTNFYLWTETNPNYKYFVFQEWVGYHDQKIFDDINSMMKSENCPLWIIKDVAYGGKDFKYSANKEFVEMIEQNYIAVNNEPIYGYILFKKK